MTNPEPAGPSQPGRRDWMLSVDGATVMLLGTLWAVTGNFWWVLLASAWARSPSSNSASLTAATPRGQNAGKQPADHRGG